MTKSKQSRRPRRQPNKISVNQSTSTIRYTGPLTRVPDDTTVTLMNDTILTTSVAGVISQAFNNDPSTARNWNEMSTSWAEYRVLGIRYRFNPLFTVNTNTINGLTGYAGVVHGLNATVPSTLASAASTGVASIFNGFKPWTREWRMSDSVESHFVRTDSPAATSSTLFLYCESGTATATYGHVMTEFLVQFRSKIL